MNIKVSKNHQVGGYLTGGEYAITTVEIFVDPQLTPEEQRLAVIHAVIETYCHTWSHDKVDDLVDLIDKGLEQLEEK